jgi:hypothetical protein
VNASSWSRTTASWIDTLPWSHDEPEYGSSGHGSPQRACDTDTGSYSRHVVSVSSAALIYHQLIILSSKIRLTSKDHQPHPTGFCCAVHRRRGRGTSPQEWLREGSATKLLLGKLLVGGLLVVEGSWPRRGGRRGGLMCSEARGRGPLGVILQLTIVLRRKSTNLT